MKNIERTDFQRIITAMFLYFCLKLYIELNKEVTRKRRDKTEQARVWQREEYNQFGEKRESRTDLNYSPILHTVNQSDRSKNLSRHAQHCSESYFINKIQNPSNMESVSSFKLFFQFTSAGFVVSVAVVVLFVYAIIFTGRKLTFSEIGCQLSGTDKTSNKYTN